MEIVDKTIRKQKYLFKNAPFRVTHNERYDACQEWRRNDEEMQQRDSVRANSKFFADQKARAETIN